MMTELIFVWPKSANA